MSGGTENEHPDRLRRLARLAVETRAADGGGGRRATPGESESLDRLARGGTSPGCRSLPLDAERVARQHAVAKTCFFSLPSTLQSPGMKTPSHLDQNANIAACAYTCPGDFHAMAPHRRAGQAGAGVFKFPVIGTRGNAIVEALERPERRQR